MGNSQIEQLIAEINRFIAKVLSDPSVVARNQAEFKATIAAATRLSKLIPQATQFLANGFERFIRELASNSTFRESVKNQFQPQSFGGVFSDPMMQLPPLPPTGDPSAQDMVKYHQEMQKYTMMMQMLSNVMQMQHDMAKNVIQNIRA